MADYTFFMNPMSRAQIARWALHEARADYEAVHVDWTAKPRALIDANPMGKLPTIIHHTSAGDQVVSEAAAICHYLAEMQATDLLPGADEKAAYFRWLFFAAGPLEAAVTNRAMGWEPKDARQEGTVGFGSFARVMDTLDAWLSRHDFVCGARFTMADVYLGSQVEWGLAFATMPERPAFAAYRDRIAQRPAWREARAIDAALMEAR